MNPPQSHVCARCPKLLGKSCCEPRGTESLALLTRSDVERIGAHTRLAPRRFVREEPLSAQETADFENRWPLYRGYFLGGPVSLTLLAREGACVFYDRATGCTLPAQVRPLACRLYPFEQWSDGSWSLAMGRYGDLQQAREQGGACLVVEQSESMEQVFAVFGTSREVVEALGAQLVEEARRHGRG